MPAAVTLAAMIAGRGLIGTGLAWNVAWTSGAVGALAGMVLARRTALRANRARWTVWLAATACWLVGQLAWDAFAVWGSPPSPNLSDVGDWAFAVLVIAGMLRAPGSSARLSRGMFTAAETVALITAATALSFAELWHDASVSTLPLAGRLSALAYPVLYVSAAMLNLQAIIGGALSKRSAGLAVVLSGIVAQALAFIFWSHQLLRQDYAAGSTLLDPLWAAGLIAIGVGGLLSARRPEPVSGPGEPTQAGGILPATLFVLLVAALVHATTTHASSGPTITLAVGLLFCGAALIARGVLLERRLRALLSRERAATAELTEREAQLARINERLIEDSRSDALTGLRNRHALADDLPTLTALTAEHGEAIAFAICDIDHFKAYNDRLGHLAGDQALRAIAATVREALRAGDVAYRFGGEELLLVLRHADARQAMGAAERIRCAVEDAALPHPDGVGGILTVSIGVAAGPGDPDALLGRADAALYDAKRGGRNCVRAASGTDELPAARQRRPLLEEPVPRHLRSMLAISRAAVSGRGEMPVLEALAHTIRSELSFGTVAVNVLDPASDELRVAVVLGDEDARGTLLDTTSPRSDWDRLLASGELRCGARWLPAGSYDWSDHAISWSPPLVTPLGPDSWDSDDMLLLPLHGADGDLLGVVSVDQPLSGRRPNDAELTVLMGVADHAGIALEQAQRATMRDAGSREQSGELLLGAMMLLAETLDLRHADTARHSRTVGAYARRIAIALGLAPDRVERIHAAGVLHDLGKLGISDAVLSKDGPLDAAQWREMQRHAELGARILDHAGMHDIAGWVRAHHERLDGRGYPNRLVAGQISLEARILSVADAYEAMTADRPYRSRLAPEVARQELLECAGTQFDPLVVNAFLTTLETVAEAMVSVA